MERALSQRKHEFAGFDAVHTDSVISFLAGYADLQLGSSLLRHDAPRGRNWERRFHDAIKRTREKCERGIDTNSKPDYLCSWSEVLHLGRCRDCGLSHLTRADICPIVRVHNGRHLLPSRSEVPFNMRANILRYWPCAYCSSVEHTLAVCPVLHGLCCRCLERGHITDDAICTKRRPSDVEARRLRFEKFVPYGLLTHCLREHYCFKPDPTISRRRRHDIDEEAKEAARSVDFKMFYQ